MPNIEISEATFARLQNYAEPLVDTVDSLISRLCDTFDAHQASHRHYETLPQEMIRLDIGTDELTHTRLLRAHRNQQPLDQRDWNSLMREMHLLARQSLGSFEALQKVSHANLRRGRYEQDGYRYIEAYDFSIQGCDANRACETSFRLAEAMSVPLRVDFIWRQNEDAAYPGSLGFIEWPTPA